MLHLGVDMVTDKKFCALCAWRENCLKKFRFSGGIAIHCSDFSRDLTIKERKEPFGVVEKSEKVDGEDT
jgi:hypothetical protein